MSGIQIANYYNENHWPSLAKAFLAFFSLRLCLALLNDSPANEESMVGSTLIYTNHSETQTLYNLITLFTYC